MDPAIRDHEPVEAFDGGAFGIEIFRGLIRGSGEYLREGGIVDNPDGSITLNPIHSEANVVLIQIGVRAGIGPRAASR